MFPLNIRQRERIGKYSAKAEQNCSTTCGGKHVLHKAGFARYSATEVYGRATLLDLFGMSAL